MPGRRPKGAPPKQKCSAKSKIRDAHGDPIRDEEGSWVFKPCENWAIRGGTVCDVHGGRTPVVFSAANRRYVTGVVFSRMQDMLEECNLDQHPLDGILDGVRRSGAMVRVLGLMVGELTTKRKPEVGKASGEDALGLYGPDHLGDAAPHVLMSMYAGWLDRHAKICKLALDADIDERIVRQYENQATLLEQAVMEAIAATSMSDQQQVAFKTALAHSLRELLPQPELAAVIPID